jgi:hypothetical protein
MMRDRDLVSFFWYGYPVPYTLFIEKTVLLLLYTFGAFVKKLLVIGSWICFGVLYSVPLVYMSTFMPVLFDYYSFLVCFEVRYFDILSFIDFAPHCICIQLYMYICICIYIYTHIQRERERERDRNRERYIIQL